MQPQSGDCWVSGLGSPKGGMLVTTLPPWEWKGCPSRDAGDPKIGARWRCASSSWSLPAAGIPWGHQLISPLTGDLKTGISSHHIPSAGFFWGML